MSQEEFYGMVAAGHVLPPREGNDLRLQCYSGSKEVEPHMEIWKLRDSVRTREDFIRFIQALRADHRDNNVQWENDTIEAFLEAMQAWIEGIEDRSQAWGRPVPEPSWQLFAIMLWAGSRYE